MPTIPNESSVPYESNDDSRWDRLRQRSDQAVRVLNNMAASMIAGAGVIVEYEAIVQEDLQLAVGGMLSAPLAYLVHKVPDIHDWSNRRVDKLFDKLTE